MNRLSFFILFWNSIQAQTHILPTATVAAPSSPTGDNTCFLQDSSYSPCPSYSKFRFPSSFNNGSFSNPYELSLYINSTLNNFMDLKNLRNIFSCNTMTYDNFNNLRYRRTQLCLYILTSPSALSCNNNSQPTPMCKSDCISSYKYFRDSISTQTTEKLKCSFNDFSLSVDRLDLTCNDSPLNGTSSNGSQCIKANDNESNTCGFTDISFSCNYCDIKSHSTDPCCTQDLKQKCTLLSLQDNNNNQDKLLSEDNNNKSMGYFIAGITCLVLSIFLILSLIIYKVVVKRFKEQSQRSSFIDQSKPMLEGTSSQFTRLDHRTNTNASSSTSPLEPVASVFTSAPPTPHNLTAIKSSGTNLTTTNPTWGITLTDPVDEDGSDLYRVAYPYQAVLEDELSLKVNQVIYLITSFDDGWGLGRNVLTGVQGAFPMACVTKLTDETDSNPGTIVVGEDTAASLSAQNVNFKTIQRRTSSQKINLKYSKSNAANNNPMKNIGFT